jgi:outer membrane murein-binding lipoprotein Lpp
MSEDTNGSRGTNIAALNQKVLGLESDVQALGTNVNALGVRVDQSIASLRQEVSAALDRISSKIDAKDDRKWMLAPAIGFLMFILTLVGGLGTMALLPIRGDQETLRGYIREAKDDRLRALAELNDRDRRMWDQIRETKSQLDYLRGQLNPLPR